MHLNRRNFLRSTGLALGLYPFKKVHAQSFKKIGQKAQHDWRIREVPTICGICPSRCLMTCRTTNNQLIAVSGNPNDPRTDGKICAIGHAVSQLLYDPDRLKYPMKRTGARGEGKWARIGWGEAIDTIVNRLEKALKTEGPESIGLMTGGGAGKFITELFHELKIPSIADSRKENCQKNTHAAMYATFGNSQLANVTRRISQAKCLVLFGSHFGENTQADLMREFLKFRANNGFLIVVDPRTSTIAAKADLHLAIRPGTDTALLLGWIQHILSSGFYNKQFIEQNTVGLDQLVAETAQYSLNLVSSITDLSHSDIQRAIEMMAANAPETLVYPGKFSAWYGNDTQRIRAQLLVNTLLADEKTFQADAENPPLQKPSFLANLNPSALIRRAGMGTLKVLGLWGNDPFHSTPNPYRTRSALQQMDFIFCTDILPTESTLYADIILPEATFLERMDSLVRWETSGNHYIALRSPVVKPLYESKDSYWIVKQLSSRLGVGKNFDFDSIEERLDYELRQWYLTAARIRQKGGMVALEPPRRKEKVSSISFPTPSGKIELYSTYLKERDESPVPHFIATPPPPDGYIRLLNGKSPVRSGGTRNNPLLAAEMPINELWLNEKLATRMKLKSGDTLYLENQDGIRSLNTVVLKVTPGIRADCVYLVHGYGAHSPFLSNAFQQGVADGSLMSRSHPDSVTGVRGMRVNFVRFVKNDTTLNVPRMDTPPVFLQERSRWWFDSFGSYESGSKRLEYIS